MFPSGRVTARCAETAFTYGTSGIGTTCSVRGPVGCSVHSWSNTIRGTCPAFTYAILMACTGPSLTRIWVNLPLRYGSYRKPIDGFARALNLYLISAQVSRASWSSGTSCTRRQPLPDNGVGTRRLRLRKSISASSKPDEGISSTEEIKPFPVELWEGE
jgi:hypothetical protein